MKLLLIFIIVPFFCFSQTIGLTESQIKKKFSDKVFITKYTEDGIKYIVNFDPPYYDDYYYFSKDGFCTLSIIEPNTQQGINAIVEEYNKTCVVVSDTQWKSYSPTGILDISLVCASTKCFFSITQHIPQ